MCLTSLYVSYSQARTLRPHDENLAAPSPLPGRPARRSDHRCRARARHRHSSRTRRSRGPGGDRRPGPARRTAGGGRPAARRRGRVRRDRPGIGPTCRHRRPHPVRPGRRRDRQAGILGGGTFRTLRPGQAERVLEVNVGGVLNTVAATIDDVIANRGQIVLTSSVFAYINGAGAIPYAMSKAAVEQLGRGLGVELAAHGASRADRLLLPPRHRHDPRRRRRRSAPEGTALGEPPLHAQADPARARGRRRSLTVPDRRRPVSVLRGVVTPVLHTHYRQDASIQRALTDLENHHLDVPTGRP